MRIALILVSSEATNPKHGADTVNPYPFGPNVELIRKHGSRVIRGTVPVQVRRELMAAVKDGELGRLKKDGLKPEVFYYTDNKTSALEIQKREALYAAQCIAGVVVGSEEMLAAVDAGTVDLSPDGFHGLTK